jgi:hypothetical protein
MGGHLHRDEIKATRAQEFSIDRSKSYYSQKFKLMQSLFDVCFIVIWIALFVHYGDMMGKYAVLGLHVVHPSLYIAIESWCLFSLTVVMLLLSKTIRDIRVDGRARGSMGAWDLGCRVNCCREGAVSPSTARSSGLLLPGISNLTPEPATLPKVTCDRFLE